MGVYFAGGSTQYLSNSAPRYVPAYPFTVGLWFRLAAAGTVARTLWAAADTGTTNNYWEIRISTGEVVQVAAAAGGAAVVGSATTAVAGNWIFALARFFSATNRRVGTIHMGGSAIFEQGGNATSTSPSGVDTVSIGARISSGGAQTPWDGEIAEYWLLDGDPMVNSINSGAFDQSMVHQLAFGGPFSMPHAAARLVEYRGLRHSLDCRSDNLCDVFSARGQQIWSATNGPFLTCHPPLPYWYERPGQVKTLLVI